MTNPALDALIRLKDQAMALCDWSEEGQVDADFLTVSTALSNAPQWQPIETAPRDGTVILGFCEDRGTETVYWSDNAWINGFFDKYEDYYTYNITHWMPLPAAPKIVEG